MAEYFQMSVIMDVVDDDDTTGLRIHTLFEQWCQNELPKALAGAATFREIGAFTIVPLTDDVNAGKCTTCDCWASDSQACEPIWGLQHGAVVDGKLYCDEHLPKGHPIAF